MKKQVPNQELSKKAHVGCPTTPALAATLTDHIWSVWELLCYNVALASWDQATRAHPKRPRDRPPKYVFAEVLAAASTAGTFTSEWGATYSQR